MPSPFASQLAPLPQDPFALKALPKWHPVRLLWTAQSRLLERASAASFTPLDQVLKAEGMAHFATDRGAALDDTAVTSGQLALLLAAVAATQGLAGDIAEVGAYRGVSTLNMARATTRRVHAVDPYIGYGGAEEDLALFRQRTGEQANISHHRLPSGSALDLFDDESLSLVFVDAIHDVSNSWFDISHWSRKIMPGGILAMHDVDDHPGSNFSARRFLAQNPQFRPWGWCPNILLVQRQG